MPLLYRSMSCGAPVPSTVDLKRILAGGGSLISELALARSKAAEQERAYRALQQHHQDAMRQIAALQLEVQRLQSTSSSSSSASASSAPLNALSGLTELQRQQLALRTGAQQTLQRLQQLFPDQKIG
jgi:hypothetical protein